MDDALLTQTKAAAMIGISKQAINHALKRGHLCCEHIGSVKFIRASEAQRYRDNRPKAGRPKGSIKSQEFSL